MVASIVGARYEKKFVPGSLSASEIHAVVRHHPAGFREVFPPRVVNNIYLDTPSRSSFQDHVCGANVRSKYRLRWYDWTDGSRSSPVLEHKHRCGALSGKATYTLPEQGTSPVALARLVAATINDLGLPPLLQLALRYTEPALLNRYRRSYFLSGDGRFRLTIDADLEYAGLDRTNDAATVMQRDGVAHVLELKYDPAHDVDASVVTNGWPFRVVRFSKYVRGLEATIGRMSNSGRH